MFLVSEIQNKSSSLNFGFLQNLEKKLLVSTTVLKI